MTFEDFEASMNEPTPPASLSKPLMALWLEGNNQWDQAHDLCNDIPGKAGNWIHAYLHRVEGDYWNADYWYHQAGQPSPGKSADLKSEWKQLVLHFLRLSSR